jgi:glycosyltransferase involved in cell wall biosynthesis
VVRRAAFAVPGDLATLTGGYAYDRRMIAELQNLGWTIDVVALGDGFPWPSQQTRIAALSTLSSLPGDAPIVVDGLALGALPEAAARLRSGRRLVALIHHPLAREFGLSAEQIAMLHDSERTALACAARVVATSETTARHLISDYAVPPERIAVARPGTDSAPPARGSNDGVVQLLSVGAVVPRKGFDVLIAALAGLTDLSWRLSIAGDCRRDRATAAKVKDAISHFDLGDRITMHGAVPSPHLAALYDGADLFVLASHFEGYGMAYAEAMAHGLAVIGTTAGAIGEAVPADAGLLVAPGDTAALASALRRLIANPHDRRHLAAKAAEAAAQLPRWQDSARKFAAVLETIA